MDVTWTTLVWAAPALLLGGCIEDNPNYREMCAPGGGGGKDRPEILVPGGKGRLGDVPTFHLDVFEVTVQAYRDCWADGACSEPVPKPPCQGMSDCNWAASSVSRDRDMQPINCVTRDQAQRFCDWAHRRLPTEAEWVFAAFGPTTDWPDYPWGQAPDPTSELLCWDRYKMVMGVRPGTCQVGSLPRGFTLFGKETCQGVADLAGNVSEWTGSCSLADGTCVFRGGSWVNDPNDGNGTPGAANSVAPGCGFNNVGFRCAH